MTNDEIFETAIIISSITISIWAVRTALQLRRQSNKKTKLMTIETKFKINDLVRHKFAKPLTLKGNVHSGRFDIKFFEIIYIKTETCTAGTQVFYYCRPFYPMTEGGYGAEPKLIDIGFGMISPAGYEGASYFREEELKIMTSEEKQFFGLE